MSKAPIPGIISRGMLGCRLLQGRMGLDLISWVLGIFDRVDMDSITNQSRLMRVHKPSATDLDIVEWTITRISLSPVLPIQPWSSPPWLCNPEPSPPSLRFLPLGSLLS